MDKETFERVEPLLYRRSYVTSGGESKTLHYAIFTDWKGIRRRFPHDADLGRARAKLGELPRKNDAEFDFDKAKVRAITFSAWAETCAASMNEANRTHLSLHLKPFFAAMALSKINETEIADYRAKREGETLIRQGKATKIKVSPSTVNHELGTLRKLLGLAHKKAIINRVPAVQKTKEQSRERVLSEEEFSNLLEKSPPWLRRVCVGAYETALSRSDLLSLTSGEIDRKQGMIRVRGGRRKTGAEQKIPIVTDGLKALVAELEAERKKHPSQRPQKSVNELLSRKIRER